MKKEVRKEIETSEKIWGFVAAEGEFENRGESPRDARKGPKKSIILKRYRYALIFPWPVRMVVRAWFVYGFMFSLSSTLGKKALVMLPLVV